MKKILSLLFFLSLQLFSKEIDSEFSMKADGVILDLLVHSGKIYATTDSSVVDVFDIRTRKVGKVIKFPKIKDFLGNISDTRIFSVDKINNSLLFVSQAQEGFSRVYLYKNNKNKLLFDTKDKLSVVKAKFISKDKIILALLSSQIILYDLKNRKFIYNKQISESKFSDLRLNRDKSRIILADESGEAILINAKNGRIIKIFKGQNLDNVYQVDYKNHIIAVASKDRRCGIYKDDGTISYHKKGNFLVYSTGLSEDGKFCGYASDFKNDVTIFRVNGGENTYKLVGDKSPVSNIIFLDDNTILTSSKNKIKIWRLK